MKIRFFLAILYVLASAVSFAQELAIPDTKHAVPYFFKDSETPGYDFETDLEKLSPLSINDSRMGVLRVSAKLNLAPTDSIIEVRQYYQRFPDTKLLEMGYLGKTGHVWDGNIIDGELNLILTFTGTYWVFIRTSSEPQCERVFFFYTRSIPTSMFSKIKCPN